MFLRLAGSVLAMGTLRAAEQAHMTISKQDTTVRVLVEITPDSVWRIEKSVDGGKTWIILEGEAIIVSQNEIQWDIPMVQGEPTALYRLKLVTTATITVADRSYQFTPSENLYNTMSTLPGLTVTPKLYTGIGQFVTSINGVAKGGGKNWILFMNGTSTTVGSLQVIPKAGDKIEWKLI